MTHTVGVIIIGNELLNGSGIESNAAHIAAFFHRRGYRVDEVRLIRDNIAHIATTVNEFAATHAYLCTSGGIGPTHDDLTLVAVARAFNVALAFHRPMHDYLQKYFPHINEPIRAHLSLLPQGTEIHPNDGHWPVIAIRNCFTLPGVPKGMRATLRRMEQITPRHEPFLSAELFVNCSENLICVLLAQLNDRFPEVEIGCYPQTGSAEWQTKLHMESQNSAQLRALTDELRDYLRRNNLLVPIAASTVNN